MDDLLENKLRHLTEAAALVTCAPESQVLQSYYLTRCRAVGQGNIAQSFTNPLSRCPHCSILYQNSCTKYIIKPAKRRNRFHRRTSKKIRADCPKTLFQHRYLKKLQDKKQLNIFNTLVITCGVCKHESNQVLKKQTCETGAPSQDESIINLKRKKKKKKDRFSGLNVDAVLSVTPQRAHQSQESSGKLKTAESTPGFLNKTPVLKSNKKAALFKEIFKKDKPKVNTKDKNKKLKAIQTVLKDSAKKSSVSALKSFLSNL